MQLKQQSHGVHEIKSNRQNPQGVYWQAPGSHYCYNKVQVDDNNTGQTVFHVGCIMVRQTLIKTRIDHLQYISLPLIPLIEYPLKHGCHNVEVNVFLLLIKLACCFHSSALRVVGRTTHAVPIYFHLQSNGFMTWTN